MFELYRQPGTLRSATPNNELHGENHVKVLYMYFVFQLSNDELLNRPGFRGGSNS